MAKKKNNKLYGINKDYLLIGVILVVLVVSKFFLQDTSKGFSVSYSKDIVAEFFDADSNPISGISSVMQGQQDVRYMRLTMSVTNNDIIPAEFSINGSDTFCIDVNTNRRDPVCAQNIYSAFMGKSCGMIGGPACKIIPGETIRIESKLICVDNDNCATGGYEDPSPFVDPDAFVAESCRGCHWQGGTSCMLPYSVVCPDYMSNGCTIEVLKGCDTVYGCSLQSVGTMGPDESRSINCDEGFNMRVYENRFSSDGFEYEGKEMRFVMGSSSYLFLDESCHECPWSWFPGKECLFDGYGVKCPESSDGCIVRKYVYCNSPQGCVLSEELTWAPGEGEVVNCGLGRTTRVYDLDVDSSESWVEVSIEED